jgi:hypothetical protein
VVTGRYVGNTPVEGAKHHHDLPRRSQFNEGDIWQCLQCNKMYRKEWQDLQYDFETHHLREEDWYWIEYDGPITTEVKW